MQEDKLKQVTKGFYAREAYMEALCEKGLERIDDIFIFSAGKQLSKANLSSWRERISFLSGGDGLKFYLKRYQKVPILRQLNNWLCHRKRGSFGYFDYEPSVALSAAGINTYQTIAYGEEWGRLFERRSFSITKAIEGAESLERQLPGYIQEQGKGVSFNRRREFIERLADFVRGFHKTGYRHRDFYFSHIFFDTEERFFIIDLSRCFKPALFSERYRLKDLSQIFYSAPGRYFSHTDRVRFYKRYRGRDKLTDDDKSFIRGVIRKARRMSAHDLKHGLEAPYRG